MRITRNPHIFSKKIKNKWVILEKNKKYIRELEDITGIIWEMAEKPVTTDNIAKKIALAYRHPLIEVQKDVENFVKKYIKAGLIEEISD